MSDSDDAAVASRALLRSRAAGVLATQSVAVEGYPLGSLVPFVLTPEGRCIVYVSRIAQHTRNFEADPRASLTVVEADLTGTSGDPQASGRVSVLGDASVLAGAEREAAQARYATFFPESVGHSGVHDFDYWHIDPVRVRYIGGFGAIHWIERNVFCMTRAEWQDGEAGIVKHINEDHREHMALIWAQHFGVQSVATAPSGETEADPAAQSTPTMLASDPEGFHMRWHGRVVYVPYQRACDTSLDVRKEMVRLTREAREAREASPA
jgi:putative heme iron utilization protein